MDVLALRDRLRGEPDDLAVSADRLALGAGTAGDLVARPDVALELDPLPGVVQDGADLDRRFGDHHVIVRMEDQRLVAKIVRRHRLEILLSRDRAASPVLTVSRTLYHTRAARTGPGRFRPSSPYGKIRLHMRVRRLAIILAVPLLACPPERASGQPKANPATPAGPVLRLGALLPLSGPGAWFGTEIKRGLELAASELNPAPTRPAAPSLDSASATRPDAPTTGGAPATPSVAATPPAEAPAADPAPPRTADNQAEEPATPSDVAPAGPDTTAPGSPKPKAPPPEPVEPRIGRGRSRWRSRRSTSSRSTSGRPAAR